jgi:hypothetical protein
LKRAKNLLKNVLKKRVLKTKEIISNLLLSFFLYNYSKKRFFIKNIFLLIITIILCFSSNDKDIIEHHNTEGVSSLSINIHSKVA